MTGTVTGTGAAPNGSDTRPFMGNPDIGGSR